MALPDCPTCARPLARHRGVVACTECGEVAPGYRPAPQSPRPVPMGGPGLVSRWLRQVQAENAAREVATDPSVPSGPPEQLGLEV